MLNINIKTIKLDKIIPIFNILIIKKIYISYLNVLNDIKSLLSINKIKIQFENLLIMSDFEKSLVKAIANDFLITNYIGFYYHFASVLWAFEKNNQC